jgi:ferredoxin
MPILHWAGRVPSRRSSVTQAKRIKRMKYVEIDEDECIGCETCVELCPDVFAFDEEENKAHVINAHSEDENCIDEAIASCPTSCISYVEE